MIRQQAFGGKGKMLKGGLHCHTTRSDGKCSPEEVIRLHVKNGYDFLALTDHRIYNYENFAPETDITIIPGTELDATFEHTNGFRTYHTVCLGENNDSNGYSQDEEIAVPACKNQEDFQKVLDDVHAKNNITFYCHPEWSSTPARYFDKLQGEFAMEVWNSGSVFSHDIDKNAPYWDEMLGLGHKIWGVAVDDGHRITDHCNGWVMVNSENNIKSILEALQNGSFYSSCGPVIKDFYVEDGVAYIEADEGVTAWFSADKHPTAKVDTFDGKASFKIGDNYEYIRVSVTDKDGKRAWTNPIFLK